MPREPPKVTGLSPKEGPPGTKVVIRGENLGLNQRDLIGLKICGTDCSMSAEWVSSSKIIARSGLGKGKGDVIVITKSGGIGTCTVYFRGFHVQTGPLQASAVWVDETEIPGLTGGRPQSPLLRSHDDPLGLSDEASDEKFSEEELQRLFPGGCGDPSSDNFVPAWFLLQNHHKASFEDLKAGLVHLKRQIDQRSKGPVSFVKSNLTAVMDCQTALTGLHKELIKDNNKNELNRMEKALTEAKSNADSLFDDVLLRKDKADATNNALNVLQRYKFLFDLPTQIDKNIQKGEYDMVINDYSRGKGHFANTDIKVFKRVYEDVEARIDKFRKHLERELLSKFPTTLDEQKRLIRYLLDLEVEGDPGWKCIVTQQTWLLQLFKDCAERHVEQAHLDLKKKAERKENEENVSPDEQNNAALESPQ